jgi:hypothetical protein
MQMERESLMKRQYRIALGQINSNWGGTEENLRDMRDFTRLADGAGADGDVDLF